MSDNVYRKCERCRQVVKEKDMVIVKVKAGAGVGSLFGSLPGERDAWICKEHVKGGGR